jgi:O-antigen ligase
MSRSAEEGWRSTRSQRATGRRAAIPTPATAAGAPGATRRGGASAGPTRGGRLRALAERAAAPVAQATAFVRGSPLRGVDWSLSLVGFLVYIVIITTYAFPGGDIAMAVALIGLLLILDRLVFTPMLAWMAAFFVWAAIGYVQSPLPLIVWPTLLDFGKLWLIALVATTVLAPRFNARLFMVLFLGCFALYPTRGAIFNYLGGYTTFGRALWNYIYKNPNDLAALAILQLSMAVALLKIEGEKWLRYCALAGLAVLPILILMTQSRGAFIALALFGLLYLAAQKKKRARTLVTLVALGAVVAMVAPGGVWQRVAGLKNATSEADLAKADREGSARQRYEIWRVAGMIIRDNPVTGVGLGAYKNVHAVYAVQAGAAARTARGKRDTHSTYLNVAAETGLPGLFLFLGLVGSVLVGAERVRRRGRTLLPGPSAQLYALEIGLIAFLVAGLWGSFSSLSFLYLHLALITVIARQNAAALAAPPPVRGSAGARRVTARPLAAPPAG